MHPFPCPLRSSFNQKGCAARATHPVDTLIAINSLGDTIAEPSKSRPYLPLLTLSARFCRTVRALSGRYQLAASLLIRDLHVQVKIFLKTICNSIYQCLKQMKLSTFQ